MSQPPELKVVSYTFDPTEEYTFYPGKLSREASFETLLAQYQPAQLDKHEDKKALFNPAVREQISKIKAHRPWFLIVVCVIQVAALVASHIINAKLTGSAIEDISTNFMIGPTAGTLILMGARFAPCMKSNTGYDTVGAVFDCPKAIIGTAAGGKCNLYDICNIAGSFSGKPDQGYRFLTAVFLHGGWIHLIMNLSFQVRAGFDLEKDLGSFRMGVIYLISGVGGFIFGSSVNSNMNSASVGASGSLYGIIACLLLDLIQNWTLIKEPFKELMKMVGMILVSFLVGMLPGVDNLAHVGGFIFGILSGLIFMPKIYFGIWDRRRKVFATFLAVPLLVLAFGLFAYSFYTGAQICPWCQYFNCIPGMPWCASKFNVTN